MGNWAINIHGVGCHHNSFVDADANKMAARFVDQLQKAGHVVTIAQFTHGGEETIDGADYLKARDAIEASERKRLGIVDPVRDPDELARKAYAAYGESTGNKNFRGEPMPTFDALPDAIKTAWRAACEAVAK
jgi:hypothetical protein